MKTSTIFLSAVIVCLVGACTFLLLTRTSDSVPSPDNASVATPLVDSAPVLPPPPPPKLAKITPPDFGAPWDYSKMLQGNCKEIPDASLCQAGILVDLTNKKVLWGKNPKTPSAIASMSKIMSSILVLEAIEKTSLDFDTVIPVSVTASKIGGSQAYIDPRESFTVDSLLQAVIIHSANDCTELLGEQVGGSHDGFVARMNQRAVEMGLRTTKFFNPHGLPPSKKNPKDGTNMASPADMAVMAEYLLQYPRAMAYSSTPEMKFSGPFRKDPLTFLNSNYRLLKYCQGCDGMKTGYTAVAKYCVTATCLRNGRRMIAVVMGVEHGNRVRDDRAKLVRSLFDWGYAQP